MSAHSEMVLLFRLRSWLMIPVLLLSGLQAGSVRAGHGRIEVGSPETGLEMDRVHPVLVVRHADGSKELFYIRSVEGDSIGALGRTLGAIDLGYIGTEPISLSWVGGIQAGALEGLSLTMGVFIGEQFNGPLGHVRTGVLLEASPGTEAAKFAFGVTAGSAHLAGLSLSATYLRSYGTLTDVPVGSDLLGVELGGEFVFLHGYIGLMRSLQSGDWYVNGGAGVKFY